MKKFFILIVAAALAAFLFCRFLPHTGKTVPVKPEVKVNPSPGEKKDADMVLKVKRRIIIQPDPIKKTENNKEKLTAKEEVIITDNTGVVVGEVSSSPVVATREDGSIVIEPEPVELALKLPETDSPLNLVVTAPFDIGLSYTFKTIDLYFAHLDFDGIITAKRIGVGAGISYKIYTAGVAETWRFTDGKPETVYFAGLKVRL